MFNNGYLIYACFVQNAENTNLLSFSRIRTKSNIYRNMHKCLNITLLSVYFTPKNRPDFPERPFGI